MPAPTPDLTVDRATERALACFSPDGGTRVGVEVEWIVVDPADPARPVGATETGRAARAGGALPAGGTVTVEPGGQLELSACCAPGVVAALALVTADVRELVARMAAAGLVLLPVGVDPVRAGARSLDLPRYRAMEAVFDAAGPGGMAMATTTAAVQVNVDVGGDPVRAWRVAGAVGPALLAAFACSPFRRGRPTGWASTRQLLWSCVPAGRGAPVPTWSTQAWVDRVLDDDLLLLRHHDDALPAPPGFSLRRWIAEGHAVGHPTAADLEEHLTTLFPPVRPRGWIELRMLDSLPAPARDVAVAVAATLVLDEDAGRAAVDACRRVAGAWGPAARDGLAHPGLADAAARCLDVAADALDHAGPGGSALAAACRDHRSRYADRRRSPAQDLLDDWVARGRPALPAVAAEHLATTGVRG